MARANVEEGKLRGCPTCGTKVSKAKMGLRDFAWVNEALPGRVGGMDIDFCISQVRDKGKKHTRVLMLELKPAGAPISTGARLTFREFARQGYDCWAVWDEGDGTVVLGKFDRAGRVRVREEPMTQDELATRIAKWWNDGYR